MSKILIAGGTGLIGSNLVNKLKQKKHEIVLLSTQRLKSNSVDTFYWNPETNTFPSIDLQSIDACINFCGAAIFDKAFTVERKAELTRSRVLPIQFLIQQFKQANCRLPYFISASATGIYPNICLNELHEDSTMGNNFISKLVKEWEDTIFSFSETSDIQCALRIGIVFSDKGGFLDQLAKPIRLFAGAIPGSGQQVISWIHINDLTDLFIHAVENKLSGIYNAVGPHPNTLKNITKQVADALHRPLFLPNIPEWALKLLFGNERYELLLCSQQVKNDKIMSTGFHFSYDQSQIAINNLLKK